MPFNEKGEIIRPENQEKTRSDIQRSTPSDDDDTSISDTQRSTPSNEDDTKDILASFGLLYLAVILLQIYLVNTDDYFLSVFNWSGCLLSLVFLILMHLCCEKHFFNEWGDDNEYFLINSWKDIFSLFFVFLFSIFLFFNLLLWPMLLSMSVILLLTHYFRSFMRVVAGVVAFFSGLIIIVGALILGVIILKL